MVKWTWKGTLPSQVKSIHASQLEHTLEGKSPYQHLCRATARARCGAATHDGTSIHGYLNASWAIPRSCSKSIRSLLYNHTPVHSSNGALAHMPLGPMHTFPLDPRSQVDLNSQVDQLTQRVDNQNNLISQLLP